MPIVDEQRALLNILEDVQEDKLALEDQRLATFNILEDITLAQEELKRKKNEIEVIADLTQKLGTSLELHAVMGNIVAALQALFPTLTVAYIVASLGGKEIYDVIYLHAKTPLGEDYLNLIQQELSLGIETLPAIKEREKWLKKKYNFEFFDGQREPQAKVLPASRVTLPLTIPQAIAGVMHLSSIEPHLFGQEALNLVQVILSSASQTIGRLQVLIASEHSRLHDLIESMSNGVIMVDLEKRVVVVNPAARKFLGAEGKTIELSAELSAMLEETFAKSAPAPLKEVLIKGRIFEAHAVPVRDWQKKVSCGAIILQDITEMKEVDRMKTEFVSVASHELRTPLTIIKQGVDLVLDKTFGELNPKQQEFLETAQRNVNRLARLINDILDISKIEANKLPLKLQAVDIVKAAEEIVNSFKPQAEERKINLALTILSEKPLKVLADPDKLNEIFYNLISNALKFTGLPAVAGEQGRVAVEIIAKDDCEEVSVSDTGIGIARENLPKLFQKFEQFGRVAGPGSKGTGLGLAITKGLVELQGGKIWAASELGQGSKFTFTIPKAKEVKNA